MITQTFLTAGRAIFTVDNGKGKHYTYRVTKSKDERNGQHTFFVSMLTGSNNEGDYTYLGLLGRRDNGALYLRPTAKSPAIASAQPGKVCDWALRIVSGTRELPAGYDIKHAGRCGRCARLLTVPESIETGLGPECAGRV